MQDWRPDRPLRLLLARSAVTSIIFWLSTVRGIMDGSTYPRGFYGFGGSGMSGDFWFPVVGGAFALALLYLDRRGAWQPFHWMLLAWHLALAAEMIRFELQGEYGWHRVPVRHEVYRWS